MRVKISTRIVLADEVFIQTILYAPLDNEN